MSTKKTAVKTVATVAKKVAKSAASKAAGPVGEVLLEIGIDYLKRRIMPGSPHMLVDGTCSKKERI